MRFHTTVARRWSVRLLLVGFLVVALGGIASADPDQSIVRVEEDWELVVGSPDASSDAPQITCVISPAGNLQGLHAALEINAQTLPVYASGGLQLQVWEGERALGERKFPNGAVFSTEGETVRWTQSMELSGGNLVFEVLAGSSTTWGAFGGQGYLKATVASALANLNGYSPAVSAGNSAVGYAGNRVRSLVLKRVRVFTSTGEEIEHATDRVVHSQD